MQGFNRHKGLTQTMLFPRNYPIPDLAGKLKGLEKILKERGHWDREYYASYRTSHGRFGCRIEGQCCARNILAAE